MNRVEKLRTYVDEILSKMSNQDEKKAAYIHLYGVSNICAMIAMKRKVSTELAMMAGMLHDLHTYKTQSSERHAFHGAELARGILKELKIADEFEIDVISNAILHHSNKSDVHTAFDEILKDADVLQHQLYHAPLSHYIGEDERYIELKFEFGIE